MRALLILLASAMAMFALLTSTADARLKFPDNRGPCTPTMKNGDCCEKGLQKGEKCFMLCDGGFCKDSRVGDCPKSAKDGDCCEVGLEKGQKCTFFCDMGDRECISQDNTKI